jgi:hypothetical protein
VEVKLHPGWAYTKVQGDETAERKNDLERKKTLDELRDSAQVQLVKFLAARAELREAERWDVGAGVDGQPFVAVIARLQRRRWSKDGDDGCVRCTAHAPIGIDRVYWCVNTRIMKLCMAMLCSSIAAPTPGEFFFVEVHNVGPDKDTIVAEIRAPVDKTAWLHSLDSGDYCCVGILPPQHNPKCHRRSTGLLDQLMWGITPESIATLV